MKSFFISPAVSAGDVPEVGVEALLDCRSWRSFSADDFVEERTLSGVQKLGVPGGGAINVPGLEGNPRGEIIIGRMGYFSVSRMLFVLFGYRN